MDKITFIVTGSEGWISKNFIDQINKLFKNFELYKINREKPLEKLHELSNKKNIILIHNIFTRAEKLEDFATHKNFIKESEKNYKYIEDFLLNSDIKGFFYPSSGSVYKIREKDKKIYKVYSDRKLEEEKLYKEICKNNNINLLIPRIFSSIGPYMNSPEKFPIGSFTRQAVYDNKIKIFSETNNEYSFCYLEILAELSLKILSSNKKNVNYVFDPVNINLSLLEIAKLVSNNFKTDIEINYNFNNTKSNENYLGEPKIYKQLLDEYKINVFGMDYYLSKNIEYIKNTYTS